MAAASSAIGVQVVGAPMAGARGPPARLRASDRPLAQPRASGDLADAPPTGSLWIFLAWWLGVSLLATVVVSLVFGLSRRLLPLGAHLEFSLVFRIRLRRDSRSRCARERSSRSSNACASCARRRKHLRPRKPPRSCSASRRRSACTTASRGVTPSESARTATCSVVSSASRRTSRPPQLGGTPA